MQRPTQDTWQDAQAELAHMARLATMGELAASIAHELNQPLTAIITTAESCLRWLSRPSPDVVRASRSASRIIGTAREASGIVQNIRAMLRKSAPDFCLLDLNEVILRAVDLVRGEIRSNAVALDIDLCAQLHPVRGNRIQLQQVVVNLVKNAIEAMSAQAHDPRLLRVSTQQTAAGGVLAVVEDSGSGLDPLLTDQLFQPFFTTKPAGMGLGLAICRSMVESHGGRLWMSPATPHGCIFQFELPGSDGQMRPAEPL